VYLFVNMPADSITPSATTPETISDEQRERAENIKNEANKLFQREL
jgi:hypothetical protein